MDFVSALLDLSITILILSGIISTGLIILDRNGPALATTLIISVCKSLVGIWFLTGLGLLIT